MIFFDSSSDSLHQAVTECPTFTCDGGLCIEGVKVCDSFVDCFDGTDELGCVFDPNDKTKSIDPDFLENINADETKIVEKEHIATVATSPTIHVPQGSVWSIVDAHLTCPPRQFRCKKMFQCISQDKVCDMKTDCNDHTDEENCKCHNFLTNTDPGKVCD